MEGLGLNPNYLYSDCARYRRDLGAVCLAVRVSEFSVQGIKSPAGTLTLAACSFSIRGLLDDLWQRCLHSYGVVAN